MLPDGSRGQQMCKSVEQAEEFLREVRAKCLGPDRGGGVTLRAWIPEVLADRQRRLLRNVYNDRLSFERHVLRHQIADMALRRIRTTNVRELIETWQDAGLSRHTRKNLLSLLRKAFRLAVNRGKIERNPVADVTIEDADVQTGDKFSYLTPDEEQRLYAVLDADGALEFKLRVQFAIATGLRVQELHALRVEDVHVEPDHQSGWMTVRYGSYKRVSVDGRQTWLGVARKNGKPLREIPLLRPALDVLRVLLPMVRDRAPTSPPGLLFPNRNGNYAGRKPPDAWKSWRARAGLLRSAGREQNFRFHDLRHTCGTRLRGGYWGIRWPISEISQFLGHSDTIVTHRYAHATSGSLRDIVAQTNRAVDGPVADQGGADRWSRASRALVTETRGTRVFPEQSEFRRRDSNPDKRNQNPLSCH